MESRGRQGGGQEGRRRTPSQDEKESEAPGETEEAAEDSGVTVPPAQEGGSEEQSDREQPDASHSGDSGTDAAFIPPCNSEQDSGAAAVWPRPSPHLATPPSDSEEEEEEEEGRVGEEEEDELIVMDPEHPLMKRFQSALKNHLNKQLERLEVELREKTAMEKAELSHKTDVGEELYGVQQELGRLQACLEGRHEANSQARAQRKRTQDQLEGVRGQYSAMASQTSKQRDHVSELQAKWENLALRLLYMREVNADLRSDIAAMKNASRKAEAEKTRSERRKREQDLYVERLAKHAEKLTEQTAMYEVQAAAQAQETGAAKEALSEAQLEMDSLAVERRQLLQEWNSCVVGMRRRDEAFTAMQDVLRTASHQVRSLDTEIEGFKKSITGEEERNELLTVPLHRAQLDAATSRKLIGQSQTQQEFLQAQYGIYMRTLQETEQSLARVNTECAVHQVQMSSLRKQVEKEGAVRMDLEDRTVAKMQEQLTHDNAAKYSRRLTGKMAAHKREREAQVVRLENDIAQATLESSEATLRLEGLSRSLAALEEEVCRRNALLSAGEAEVAKRVTVIERKQASINMYNSRIEQVVASTGHEDLGPLEIQAAALTKQLDEASAAIKEQQQFWLWQEGELVRLTRDSQAQNATLLTLRAQLTILQQRKVRTEGDIEREHRERAELERHRKTLRADILKLNSLLSQNGQLPQALEQSNLLMETDFLHRLKEAEKESIEMQMKLERIQEERERVLNSLVEAERQIMLWERKTQLVRETRLAVDSEVGQGDIHTMKVEIHRMKVRYGQLMKHQERVLRDMEASVARRETMVVRSEVRADHKQPTHASFHAALQGLRRKIQDTQKQAEECDGVIVDLGEGQVGLSSSLRDKQLQLGELHGASAILTSDLRSLQDAKERNFVRLVSLQGRTKHLQAAREGRYNALATGGPEALEPALQRQEERLRAVASILRRLSQEFPQHKGALRRLSLTLESQ